MGPGSPTDDKQPAAGPDPHPSPWEDPWASIADQNRWLEANLILERRYLELGRAQIDEMCLDLKARLAARMSAGLRDRLAAAPQSGGGNLRAGYNGCRCRASSGSSRGNGG